MCILYVHFWPEDNLSVQRFACDLCHFIIHSCNTMLRVEEHPRDIVISMQSYLLKVALKIHESNPLCSFESWPLERMANVGMYNLISL